MTLGRAFAVPALLAALAAPGAVSAQQLPEGAAAAPADAAAAPEEPPAFSQEQLDQMLAPIALYPDDLLSQILMACTYPLEIVQADRWAQANKDMKPEEASKALEAEDWDPSVKSLVAVPDVLALLSEKLDWTQQLGDAFIAQQEQVMATVQALRAKAKESGHLESNKDMTVEQQQAGEKQTIVIESAQPDVIYVPVYETTVVYGTWPYPAYPPYPYYPPAWHYGAAIAVGFAWGYAWGNCDWNGGDVDVDIDRNTNINNNIDRDKYKRDGGGRGNWKHDPQHRGNQPYRDKATANRFGGKSAKDATAARESFRGRGSDAGSPRVIKGGADGGAAAGNRPSTGNRGATIKEGGGGSNWVDSSRAPGARDSKAGASGGSRDARSGSKSGALDGVDRGGQSVRRESQRGSSSRGSASRGSSGGSRGSSGARYSGGRGGGGRGGGGRGPR